MTLRLLGEPKLRLLAEKVSKGVMGLGRATLQAPIKAVEPLRPAFEKAKPYLPLIGEKYEDVITKARKRVFGVETFEEPLKKAPDWTMFGVPPLTPFLKEEAKFRKSLIGTTADIYTRPDVLLGAVARGVRPLTQAKGLQRIEKATPLFEKAGVKFPQGWSARRKAVEILNRAQVDPKVGNVVKRIISPQYVYGGAPSTKQIANLAKQFNIPIKQIETAIKTGAYAGLPAQVVSAIQRLVKPLEVPLATKEQKAQAHIIAQKKEYISEKGKMKPQYRRLAQSMTGKKSMKDMTEKEANVFISAIGRLPEPIVRVGKIIPPSIPTTKKLTPEGFFQRKFKEPTFFKTFTPQTYYAQKLGVKPLVEPLEIAKQEFDISFRDYSNNVDRMIGKIDALGKTTLVEKSQAKIKNLPTRAIANMRDLLNTFEEAPNNLSQGEKDIFNYFRDLNRSIHNMENKVRESLDIAPIPYRKAYVRHTADSMAQEMLAGRYPFPEGLKYWSQQMVGQKVFNPMEMQRKLADDLEGLWTKDLAQATKSMLWTGLKEIHLSQPLKFFKEQLGAVSKDPAYYKNLTPSEREIVDAQQTIPASTKKWLIDYVNQVIKGQETHFDESINKLVTQSGLKGIFNKILAPFGRTVGRKPLTHLFQFAGRLTIHGVMGGIRPRQLIRNKFQTVQNLGLYTLKANLKAFLPATDKMKELMTSSLFLKTYSGFEELPTNVMAMLEKANLAPFQWSALSNVKQAMKTSYWDTMDLIANPKYKNLGWADTKRTYKEPKEMLYPSEQEKMLKEMEFGAGVTQYHYIPMGMPEMFRHKALVPITRLQSWWQNYFFKFNRECISRALSGETGYGAKLPWSRRIGYLRYLILGGLILNTLGYEKSFLFGAAPTGLPPTATLMLGVYNYVTADEDTTWGKRKKGEAKYQIINSLKTFIPAYMSVKDIIAVWEGRKDLKSLFFYTKIKEREAEGFQRQEFQRQEYQRQPYQRQELRLLRK